MNREHSYKLTRGADANIQFTSYRLCLRKREKRKTASAYFKLL